MDWSGCRARCWARSPTWIPSATGVQAREVEGARADHPSRRCNRIVAGQRGDLAKDATISVVVGVALFLDACW
jgi:hypothetical protein